MVLTALDLFCGAGGMSLGLARSGFELVGALDSWPVAIDTYTLNFRHPAICAQIEQVSGDELRERLGIGQLEVDLLAGGPPCQGFSIQRVGSDEDARNALILEFARLVTELKPRAFLMENVPGLLGRRGRPLAKAFEERLLRGGYKVACASVNAADYGVPQIRRRIFYYGWRPDRAADLSMPVPTFAQDSYRTVGDAIGGLDSPPSDNSPSQSDPLHRRMRLSSINLKRLRAIPPGGGMMDLPVELRVPSHRNGAERIGHRFVYGRLAGDRPAGTITGRFDSFTRGKFAHPVEDRNITLREGRRLQSFPDGFQFAGTQEAIAALIGNAVPPQLAQAVGCEFARQLLKQAPNDRAVACQLPLLEQPAGA